MLFMPGNLFGITPTRQDANFAPRKIKHIGVMPTFWLTKAGALGRLPTANHLVKEGTMSTTSHNIVDVTDHCRMCRGKGGRTTTEVSERTGRNVEVFEACYMCEGTGRRTVIVRPADTESDGVASLPFRGAIGPDHPATSRKTAAGDPAQNPEARVVDDVILKMLATQTVSHDPNDRKAQIDWARGILWSDERFEVRTTEMACRVLEALSRDHSERLVAEVIRQDLGLKASRAARSSSRVRKGLAVTLLFGLAVAGVTLGFRP